MWVARGRQGAAQKPGGSPICRTYHTTAGGNITCTAPCTAGLGSREWAGLPAALSQRPESRFHYQTALRTGQSEVAVTQPLSPSHKSAATSHKRDAQRRAAKSEPLVQDGDDDAALQLLRPVSRPPQPLQLAHSLRASDEPPEAPASQSSSASYASPRLPCGVLLVSRVDSA